MEPLFDHEKLHVYQQAIAFDAWWSVMSERVPSKLSVKDQIDRASTSSPLNIAEGNGKYSSRERCHYLDIARGSALECASGLDVLVARRIFTTQEVYPGKRILHGVVNIEVNP